MPKGHSLHIGLNYVDTNHYGGWDGKLNSAENDANDMALIAKSQGFMVEILLGKDATRESVIKSIQDSAKNLVSGDIYLISYSGHGGQVPDKNSDESDGLDETWCLFNAQLIDDELKNMWSKFQEGVRVIVFSDSCHSGTVTRTNLLSNIVFNSQKVKYMSDEIAQRTYMQNMDFYNSKASNVPKAKIKASIKLISGCQDNQSSYDGPFNGFFTGFLKKVWNGGKFSGNYSKFHQDILRLMPSYQSPNYTSIGISDEQFDNEKPFTIE